MIRERGETIENKEVVDLEAGFERIMSLIEDASKQNDLVVVAFNAKTFDAGKTFLSSKLSRELMSKGIPIISVERFDESSYTLNHHLNVLKMHKRDTDTDKAVIISRAQACACYDNLDDSEVFKSFEEQSIKAVCKDEFIDEPIIIWVDLYPAGDQEFESPDRISFADVIIRNTGVKPKK